MSVSELTTWRILLSSRREWLTHVLAWCKSRGERHAYLIGPRKPVGIAADIEVAPGLWAVAAPVQPAKPPECGGVVAVVPLDVLAKWLATP